MLGDSLYGELFYQDPFVRILFLILIQQDHIVGIGIDPVVLLQRIGTCFVQRNNVLNLSSATLYYEFPLRLISGLKLSRLRLSLYTNDIYTFSSIEIERGTSYPYARKFSFSVNASF